MRLHPSRWLSRFAVVCLLSVALPAHAEGWATLIDGVLVDTSGGRALVMAKKGGISLVELATGKVKWTNKDNAAPVAVTGESVVALHESGAPGELWLTVLDLATGKETSTLPPVPVPVGVRTSIGTSEDHAFGIYASRVDGPKVTLDWYVDRWFSGEGAPAKASAPRERQHLVGTFKVNLTTGKLLEGESHEEPSHVGAGAIGYPAPPRETGGLTAEGVSFEVLDEEQPDGSVKYSLQRTTGTSPQPLLVLAESAPKDSVVVSADGTAVAVLVHDTKGHGGKVTIFSVNTGEKIAQLAVDELPVPFVLGRSTVSWFNGSPSPHLRTVELTSGKTLASIPLRDVAVKTKP